MRLKCVSFLIVASQVHYYRTGPVLVALSRPLLFEIQIVLFPFEHIENHLIGVWKADHIYYIFPISTFHFSVKHQTNQISFFLFYRWAFQLHKSVKEWFFLVVASFVTSVSFRTEMEICAVQTIYRFFFMFIKGSHIYARLNKSDKKRDAYALFLLLCKCMHICESTEFCIWSLGCCSVHLFPACHCIVWKSLWLVAFQTV